MNRPRNLGSRRILAYMAMLLGAMLTTMALPAYGQQDVDPTWYDPYAVNTPSNPAAAQTVAMHSSPTPVAMRQHQRPLSSGSLTQGAEKFRAQQSTGAPKIRSVSMPRDGKQEEKAGQIARRRDQAGD